MVLVSRQTISQGAPMTRSFFVALAASLAFSAPASATLLTNGSFELGTTGWSVGGGGVDVVSGWHPTDGSNIVDLNAFTPGSLSQIISTIVGQAYVLEFDLSGNFSTTSTTKTVDVVAGSTMASYSFARPLGWTTTNMFWAMNIQQAFIATATSTTISFTSTIGGSEGVALDAISVTAAPVPAPAALALLALGLAAIGFSRRRKLL
ncbi:MAG: DUF642 domain-containing protein [Betaproteobacteria bacterium]